jgi:transposase
LIPLLAGKALQDAVEGAGSIYPPENLPEGTRQFRKIYRDELIRRLAAAGHKQKDIAEKVGLSKGHVSEIVNKKSSGIEHELTIKSTSAAEELEAKQREIERLRAEKEALAERGAPTPTRSTP